MVELVDTRDLKSLDRNIVPVQVRPRVPCYIMKKKWLIASFKINEVRRLEINLLNQNFEYYLPKITTKKINSSPKKEALFPGYIFVNTSLKNYSALRYTIGIKEIIKFGDNIPHISDRDIKSIQMVEKSSKVEPITAQIQIGQDVLISKGSLKGNIVKICSLHSRERVGVFLCLLGSKRRIIVSKKDIIS